MVKTQSPMRIALYARVSKVDDPENGNGVSIELQVSKLRALAEAKSWLVAETYIDDGESARDMNRLALQRMLQDMKGRAFDALLIYRFDRLARNLKDLLTIMEACEKRRVAVVSLSESLDGSTPAGKFAISILGAAAALEREQIAARTRDALRFKRSQLRPYSGEILYGFRRVKDRLEPIPAELEVIAQILDMRKHLSLSLRAIAARLDAAKIPTKKRKGRWSPEVLRGIVSRADFYRPHLGSPPSGGETTHDP